MAIHFGLDDFSLNDPESNTVWQEYYPQLQVLARTLVFSLAVPRWCGQEQDVAEDIVQETVERLIEYGQKAKRCEVLPIRSLKHLMASIAGNYSKDLRRRDIRVVRTMDGCVETSGIQESAYPLEAAIDNVYQEWLFKHATRMIARFPEKQRRALLIDLANTMRFDGEFSALQLAFLKVGIRLQDYQQVLPVNPVERSRHASLLCQAYKRLALLSDNLEEGNAAC